MLNVWALPGLKGVNNRLNSPLYLFHTAKDFSGWKVRFKLTSRGFLEGLHPVISAELLSLPPPLRVLAWCIPKMLGLENHHSSLCFRKNLPVIIWLLWGGRRALGNPIIHKENLFNSRVHRLLIMFMVLLNLNSFNFQNNSKRQMIILKMFWGFI